MYRSWLKRPLFSAFYNSLVVYAAPSNLTYLWNYGFLAGFVLVVQILTGVFLAMHYVPESRMAMSSVEHIMRDVQMGWLVRYIHANGASLFFVVVYIHIARGLYYGSYLPPRHHLWLVGVALFFLMIITAFLGYVLPWGQMSFWAATVITNLVSAFPVFGTDLVIWLWGGYAVDNPTLNRFFRLHFLLPFVILGLVIVHVLELHEPGSNNPLGVPFSPSSTTFHPYFTFKDRYGVVLLVLLLLALRTFRPNFLGHPDNYIRANPMATPAHIVPEWYFLPFYAILRSIPSKLGGVVALLFSVLALCLLPYISRPVRSVSNRPFRHFFFYVFFLDVILLGYLGSCPAEQPYIFFAQFATAFYFFYILVLVPFFSWLDYYVLFNLNTNCK